ncbi:MAG: hypothetical protein JRH07_08945 [Deltaproteobacteria bacterium]|nr:hypothetical protein [Deltaproteobacteria bacterium]
MAEKARRYGLEDLVSDYGAEDLNEMLEEYGTNGTFPGICPECGYTTDVEPDQAEGWCEVCEKNTVVSGLILAGFI